MDGLAKSYGPQRLAVYAMKPGLGPPDAEHVDFPPQDTSWQDEWRSIRDAVAGGDTGQGDLESARYAWGIVEEAYRRNGYPLNSLAAQGSAS